MSIHTRHRKDSTHRPIAKGLRQIPGVSVLDISQLDGTPDILVGFKGYNILVELKSPGEKLRPNQVAFRDSWKGTVIEARTLEEILDALHIGKPVWQRRPNKNS